MGKIPYTAKMFFALVMKAWIRLSLPKQFVFSFCQNINDLRILVASSEILELRTRLWKEEPFFCEKKVQSSNEIQKLEVDKKCDV